MKIKKLFAKASAKRKIENSYNKALVELNNLTIKASKDTLTEKDILNYINNNPNIFYFN